jgi:NADH dehydrogenase [ubiquinone] 1 alpha subcomplex assembly factor 6
MTVLDSYAYCADEVRRFDYDHYLAALFAPPDRRAALMALYAFNLEISKIREVVSEPLIGRIRLQWWRERIDDIFAGNPPRHEVAIALAEGVVRHGLQRRLFDRLVDAREADLWESPPVDLAALEAYVEGVSSTLVGLSLEILRAPDENVARSAGLAWGLTGLLRALPHHRRTGRLYLPADLLRSAGVTPDEVFARRKPQATAGVVQQVADVARHYLAAARSQTIGLMPAGMAAVLPLALVDGHLNRMRRRGYDVLGGNLEMGRLSRQFRIGLAAVRKRI